MNREIYCTKAITSFNVTKNELVDTLIYIPYQRAYQDTWWGGSKMIIINPCWLYQANAYNNNGLNCPKHLDAIKYAITEYQVVYDIDKAPNKELAVDSMEKHGYSIENSDFAGWFSCNFDSDDYYYETVTNAMGQVIKINIFKKGCIEITFNEDNKFGLVYSKFIADDFEVGKILKKVGQAIIEYPFFTVTEDGNFNFLKLNDNSDMLLII
jgi:hypothetical protein